MPSGAMPSSAARPPGPLSAQLPGSLGPAAAQSLHRSHAAWLPFPNPATSPRPALLCLQSDPPMHPVLDDLIGSGLVRYQYLTNDTTEASRVPGCRCTTASERGAPSYGASTAFGLPTCQGLLARRGAHRLRLGLAPAAATAAVQIELETPRPGRSYNWQRPVYRLCLERFGARHTWMGEFSVCFCFFPVFGLFGVEGVPAPPSLLLPLGAGMGGLAERGMTRCRARPHSLTCPLRQSPPPAPLPGIQPNLPRSQALCPL